MTGGHLFRRESFQDLTASGDSLVRGRFSCVEQARSQFWEVSPPAADIRAGLSRSVF